MKNLEGQRFGRLTIIERASNRKSDAGIYWRVQCDCGNIREVRSRALTSGVTQSCGCLAKELQVKRQTLPNDQGKINTHYRSYIHNANRRKYAFELDIDQFTNLIRKPCHYCGKLRVNANGLMGIDRLDNAKGYTSDNVVSCCGICNRAKDTRSEQEYNDWIIESYFHMSDIQEPIIQSSQRKGRFLK